MEAYKIATRIDKHGALILDKLPFQAGDRVEVIVLKLPSISGQTPKTPYPLHGTVVRYDDPFSPVAESEWEVLQ